MRLASVVLIGWALSATGLAWLDVYRGASGEPPTIQYGIGIPMGPVVALLYARNPEAGSGAVAAWNIAGIADLVVAVTTGFLTSPSAFQLFAVDAPNQLVDALPLAMVPVFLVPLSIVLHFASLAKLRRTVAVEAA